ncbi:MAG: hypothetical protein NDI63_01350 [Pseudobdellovibrio sp.]|nr:hypothetical protein [Pseudobdellovibrio sp.]
MNSQKLNRVNLCLYAMCGIRLAAALYTIATMSSLSFNSLTSDLTGVLAGALFLSVGISIFTVFIIDGLKKQKLWAWVSALSVLLFSLPSFAFPAAIIGILSLLDVEVRTPFLKELDLKF